MRAVCVAIGLLLPAALLARPAGALSQCPGIEEKDGQTGVHLVGPGTCTGSACSSGPGSLLEEIAGPLCEAAFNPAECGQCECCRNLPFDLFTGTDLQLVGPDPMNFCGIGNRGQPMGEAALCLLRDLAEPARGPSLGGAGIRLKRQAGLAIGPLSVEQHVGFIDFSLAARRMRGFHDVSVCAPVLGCISHQVQPFTATLQQVSGLIGACGDYQFRTPWILRVQTQQLEQNVGLTLPPIPIYTPVGIFRIKPLFSYELNLEAVTSPWAGGNTTTKVNINCADYNFHDVVDAPGGIFVSLLAATTPGRGWDARLGLGTRDPDPEGQVWVPPAMEFPERPDFDFSVARQQNEKRPTARFHTGIEVTYPIGDLAAGLAVPPLELRKAEVFVSSALDAAFVSQFALAVDEGKPGFHDSDCTPAAQTRLRFQSAIDALAAVLIKAGVRIEFVLDLGFFGEKTFKFNPTVDVVSPEVVSSSPVVGPDAMAAMRPDKTPPSAADYFDFVSFSDGAENGNAFVDACLVEPPPPPREVPTPVVEPGDPRDLVAPQDFPCNICLYFPGQVTQACLPRQDLITAGVIPPDYDQCDLSINGMPCTDPNCANVTFPPVPVNLKTVLFPTSQAALPAPEQWMCNAFEKFGCYDLCHYDPNPNAIYPLTITQSAVAKIGPRCRDATGGSDPSPQGRTCGSDAECNDGNPCTVDDCALSGEFLICQISQSQGPCDDGLFCDGADTCALGICGAHAGNPCAASAQCCNEADNSCPASCPQTPCEGKNVGDSCDDGSACTIDDRCAADGCRGTAALSCPGSTCLAGICEDIDGAAQCTSVASGFCPPECGDGGLDPDEECDGANDAACPGKCLPDCSCQPPGEMNGEPCTSPSVCASGFCTDGVCCTSACTAPLQQCNLPGREGTCTVIAAPAPALSLPALLGALAVLTALAHLALRRRP